VDAEDRRVSSSAVGMSLRRSSGVTALIASIIWSIYALWILTPLYNRHFEPIIGSILAFSFSSFFGIFSWRVSTKQTLDSELRRSWKLFAFAAFSNCVGEFFWFYYESILHQSPFVTYADIFYLMYYPLLLAGVLTLPRAPANKEERIVLSLDLAIIMITTFTIVWYFVLAPMGSFQTFGLKEIVAISYPIGAVMVIAAVITLMERDLQKIAFWPAFFLATGMGSSAIADTFFAYFGYNHIPYVEANLNILWIGALVFLLIAVACQDLISEISPREKFSLHHSRRIFRAILPYVSTLVGIVLLLVVVMSLGATALRFYGVLFGALALVALVLLRQDVLLRENNRLYHQMEHLALTDSLTGVYNRHHTNDVLQRELLRAQRHQRPLSVLLMDLDEFKKYNDTMGHLRGDEVLKIVARTLNDQLRATDMLGRFGGDEFIAILPETDLEGAQFVADKMKNELSRMRFSGISIGITIGVATYSAGASPEDLLEEADRDLYRLKQARV